MARHRTSAAECGRSEEHTSELQSPCNLVCRLLLEKKKTKQAAPLCMFFFFFLMIRRPPRSTLFPYHDALPISTEGRVHQGALGGIGYAGCASTNVTCCHSRGTTAASSMLLNGSTQNIGCRVR